MSDKDKTKEFSFPKEKTLAEQVQDHINWWKMGTEVFLREHTEEEDKEMRKKWGELYTTKCEVNK